jgi:ribulose-phosphate 3-epimerase
MPEIAGSLWSVAPQEQLVAAERLRTAGLRRLHWDMSDGRFASPGGFTSERARLLTHRTGLAAEAHIMAVDPLRYVDEWTDFCDLVVVHLESLNWRKAVGRIESRGCIPGIAISPATPADAAPADLPVLCMAIAPGAAGSGFTDSTLLKLPALRTQSPSRRLGLDGGVQRGHVQRAQLSGADWLVVGTDLFRDGGEVLWADLLYARRTPDEHVIRVHLDPDGPDPAAR